MDTISVNIMNTQLTPAQLNASRDTTSTDSALESVENLVSEYGDSAVAGALENMTMKEVAEAIKDLVAGNDDLAEAIKDIAMSIIDGAVSDSKKSVSSKVEDAVAGNEALAETSKDWFGDIMDKIMRQLAEINDKENGAGSTEGKSESNKAKGGKGGGNAEGGAAAEGAGGAEGVEGGGAAEGGGETKQAQNGESPGEFEPDPEFESAGGNWLEVLAEGMALIQSKWLSKATDAQETMNNSMGESKTQQQAFTVAQSKYTAAMQMFSMTAAATSTSLKTIGEGLAGIARKQ